jgi:hypothetical protein
LRRATALASILTVTALTAAFGAAVTAPPAAAVSRPSYRGANTPAVQNDFNGDGYRDVAVGAPGASRGDDDIVGAVDVFYGSKSGISASRHQVVSQASPGVPGTAEPGDLFGQAVASADLDGDGYADLLVGDPRENVSGHELWGSVTVLWGGPQGLSGGATLTRPAHLDTAGVGDCGFGMSLAVGDVDGDGHMDVAVGSHCAGVLFSGPFTRAGKPAAVRTCDWLSPRSVMMGDVDGDGKAELFWLEGPVDGDLRGTVFQDNGTPQPDELPLANGWAGEVGDVNGDGYGDLVTGVPDDDYLENATGAAHKGGEIEVLYGGPKGIDPAQKPQVIDQDTAGVPGTGENADQFGLALSVADTDGDGYGDVLVGAPGESIGSKGGGAVTLLHGSKAGLTGIGATTYNQSTAGIPGTPERPDSLGAAVYLSDDTGDGHPEAVIGIPGEDKTGCVLTLPGTRTGPTASHSSDICGANAGITTNVAGYGLGAALTSARSAIDDS